MSGFAQRVAVVSREISRRCDTWGRGRDSAGAMVTCSGYASVVFVLIMLTAVCNIIDERHIFLVILIKTLHVCVFTADACI